MSSVGWETRCEGIKDYRYLRALEQLLGDASGAPVASAARSWLDQLKGRVGWDTHANRPETAERWDERDLYSQCPNIAPAEFARVREEAIESILGLIRS